MADNSNPIPFKEISDKIGDIASKFGFIDNKNKKNAVFRNYTTSRGYLAFINPDQRDNGPYNGLSYVIFPIGYKPSESKEKSEFICVVAIGIGRDDIGSDEELANIPYLRRCYLKLTKGGKEDYEQKIFIKSSFADGSSDSTDLYNELYKIRDNATADELLMQETEDNGINQYSFIFDLSTIEQYRTLLPAARIVKFKFEDCFIDFTKLEPNKTSYNGFHVVISWLAQYAEIRNWDFGGSRVVKPRETAISLAKLDSDKTSAEELTEIYRLLNDRHFVVLQGAPGVGKTYTANLIGSNLDKLEGSDPENIIKFDRLFFTQFHAETTYADFIGGIRPKLNSNRNYLEYEYNEGTLTEAIKTARSIENKDKNYLLIIDEINRANLANVLGPVFYLFERTKRERQGLVKLEIKTNKETEDELRRFITLSSMPDNLYVIATMNTADRSLAVVDFALRRRFAWYTLKSRAIKDLKTDEFFHEEAFNKIAGLFEKYASDEELNLQPGPGYFILDKKNDSVDFDDYKEEMGERLTYEIMPLMKEYFTEGLMVKAQDEFANYYYEMTKKYMYR